MVALERSSARSRIQKLKEINVRKLRGLLEEGIEVQVCDPIG